MPLNIDERVIINFLYVDCIRNYAIHKAIIDRHLETPFTNNFWRVTSNSTRDFAVIQWCKLFGSHSESTHWKNQSYILDFPVEVLNPLDLTKSDWEPLHDAVVEYRDRNAAHIDLSDWYRDIPVMTTAINILYKSFELFSGSSHSGSNLKGEFLKVYEETKQVIVNSSLPKGRGEC
jgi:hypothetical protein